MSVASKRIRQLAISSPASARETICKSCLHRIRQTRQYAIAVAAEQQQSPVIDHQQDQSKDLQKAYRLLIAPVVSRPPLLTRELSEFEKSFYLYQKRLNERLAQPLTRYFYYKKGTPGDIEWKRRIKSRQTAARDIGKYNAYGEYGWNDEVLLGDKTSEPEVIREALLKDAEGKDIFDDTIVTNSNEEGTAIGGDASLGEGTRQEVQVLSDRPASRQSEADLSNDRKSLSRKMDRVLYLLIKNQAGRWRFPEDRLAGPETLHQAAERVITQSAGINMNTWVVGNHPIGHFQYTYAAPKVSKISGQKKGGAIQEREQEEYGEKVFFMKARIFAGQADLSKNMYGDSEFQWLTKEEIQSQVTEQYWSSIRNMLTER